MEEKGNVDLAQIARLLEGVSVETGLNSGRALLLFIQVALLGLQSKVIHLDIASVQSSYLGLAFENDVVDLTALSLASVSEEVV